MKIRPSARGNFRQSFCRTARPARITWIASLVFSAALVLLPWLVKLDGKPHADWQQFLGRFHPLAVHLPIGFLLLVPLLEIAGVISSGPARGCWLRAGACIRGALLALTLGMLLAYGSGDSGHTVTRHMAGGIALTIGVLLCILARPLWLQRT